MAPQCNIDARGRVARLIWGVVTLLIAVTLAALRLFGVLESNWWWVAVGAFGVSGAFGIYEARAGWCVVRAMGIRTKF